jgi:hypothetical protein
MSMLPPTRTLKAVVLAASLLMLQARAEPLMPADSRMGSAPAILQRLLLSPLDTGAVSNQAKYKLKSTSALAYPGLDPKVGLQALKFSGIASMGGAKGDFSIVENPPGEIQELGMWVYLAPESNVSKVGFQCNDAEGESLLATVDADWQGWKWIEISPSTFAPSYKQEGKTGQAEFPLRNVHIIWHASGEGPTSLGVDALTALSKMEAPPKPFRIETISPPWGEAGQPFQGQVVLHNFSDKPLEFQISASLQTNPTYETPILPDPIQGSDLAQGKPSWLEIAGERIDNNCLTDRDDSTHLTPEIPKSGCPEIFHFVDLGESRNITGLGWRAGDANWINRIDISASGDGKTYTPVEGFQNLDFYKKWGPQSLAVGKPFPARFLRLRYHNGGESLPLHFRSLAALFVYDGVADETPVIPTVGKEISAEPLQARVPPKDFKLFAFKKTPPLGPDAYLFGISVEAGGLREIAIADYFVMPAADIKLRPESRFGINVGSASNIPLLARAGFGWVRFENMKWRFYNPAPDDFRFDGSVEPWLVPFDEYYKAFQEAGMSILPYIFQTPDWAGTAPAGTEKNVGGYPPKDPADYGKAIFQAVARYGSAKVADDRLLTTDRLSGLNRIHTYELWNEQNLSNPGYGFFVGPLSAYYSVFRAGAEAAKRADPAARVTNGGWAGLSMEWIDTMRTFQYPDGKGPLDFTDVLNVHFYAGRSDPEFSTKDPNASRDGAKPEDIQTLENDLVDLADWRDELKPGMPLWVTETGHDVGGPIGLTERHQAAKLPRGNMLSFANGVEKVFIYREAGSIPAQHAGAGLLRSDGSLRASFFTMATQARQLDGAMETRVPRLCTDDPGVWMYYWKRPGGDVLAAWAPKGPAPLGIDLGRCLVTGAFGAENEMEVAKDFRLGMFPVYISKIGRIEPVVALQRKAAERDAARKKKIAFEAGSGALLLDFGSTEFVGTKKVGKIRPFTPVLAEDVFDPAKGFGFESRASGKNIITAWKPTALEKDSVELKQPAMFKILAKPGAYELRFKGRNFGEGAELVVTGAKEGEIKIPLKPGKDGAPTEARLLTVTAAQTLDLLLPAGNTEWLTLIELYRE